MNDDRPRFHLAPIHEPSDDDTPELVQIVTYPLEASTNRRGFLRASIGGSALMLSLGASVNPSRSQAASLAESAPTGAVSTYVAALQGTRILKAHARGIASLAISPDGQTLASGAGDDPAIKLWSLGDVRLTGTIARPVVAVNGLSVSADGQSLVGAHMTGINAWSIGTGESLASAQGLTYIVTFTPDGALLVAGGTTLRTVSWPALTPGQPFRGLRGAVYALAVSPDGTMLASGGDGRVVQLWSLPDGGEPTTLEGHTGPINGAAFSPDGSVLATASADRTIRLWQLPSRQLAGTLAEHTGVVNRVAFTPDGSTLVSVGDDRSVRLWSMPDGKLAATLTGHEAGVRALAITPDGSTVATGDANGAVILWDLAGQSVRAYLFDPAINSTEAFTYTVNDRVTGRTITYTLPCGSPLPNDAVCICNCVPGAVAPPAPPPPPPTAVPKPQIVPGRTETQPCGAPIPPGAICTCNCIPGR